MWVSVIPGKVLWHRRPGILRYEYICRSVFRLSRCVKPISGELVVQLLPGLAEGGFRGGKIIAGTQPDLVAIDGG